jgi:hypothetical protein
MNCNTSTKLIIAVVCGLVQLTTGIAAAANSGFLPDYSRLEPATDDNGKKLERWVSPSFTKVNYQKILIEPVAFYPAPKGSEQVSDQALADIQGYLDSQLRTVGLVAIPQVSAAGPGVARVRVGITAVATSATGLKPWQIIPIALVAQGAKAATGRRAKDAELAVEALITDSVSNEPLAMVVRKAEGVTLPDSKTQLTLDTVRATIDRWAANVAEQVQQRIK